MSQLKAVGSAVKNAEEASSLDLVFSRLRFCRYGTAADFFNRRKTLESGRPNLERLMALLSWEPN
ncbi:rCG46176 [Rattus norvegicus]|uniref:RCG46176 n=1 Tax=Rattus norvegicus TaxID=10116 RepID=A6IDF4_RAT|nr:rCG46176 [Rattus norvegicus]